MTKKNPGDDKGNHPLSKAEILRAFMRNLPQPVLVVTTKYEGGLWGLTMSSFTSASLSPPLVLICIDKKTPSYEPILKRGWFAVNLLNENQSGISDLFAGRFKEKQKFQNIKFHLTQENDLPIIEDSLGYLECKIWRIYEAGDHDILVAEVMDGEARSGLPIVYYDQSYGKLGRWEGSPSLYPPY